MSERRLRLVSPAGLPGPSGGTSYNQRVAAEWGIEVEYLPGGWPDPSQEDLDALAALLHRSPEDCPVLLDGLIGSAAGPVLSDARRSGKAQARARVVVIVHLPLPAETGLSVRQQALLSAREQAALQAADGVACTSAWAAADLRRRYGLSGVVVTEPGTDIAPLATGSRPPRLLTLGSFSPRKNHHLLLEALSDSRLRPLDWNALWVGPDPVEGARDRLAHAVSGTTHAPRIEVSAARTGHDLERTWAGTDLLLLPSWAETFAMVVTEALARGIPAVVASGTGAESTLSAAGAAGCARGPWPGVAVDPGSPRAWAEVVHAWLTDETVRRRWRQGACDRRGGLMRWPATAQRLRQILHEEEQR